MFLVEKLSQAEEKNNKVLKKKIFTQTHVPVFNIKKLLNPLQPGVAFLYPLKTSENLQVF